MQTTLVLPDSGPTEETREFIWFHPMSRSHGVEDDISSAWIGASYAAFAADSATAEADTFQRLLNEQTPGGLNEKARAGRVLHSVDLLLLNFVGIWPFPGLAIVG